MIRLTSAGSIINIETLVCAVHLSSWAMMNDVEKFWALNRQRNTPRVVTQESWRTKMMDEDVMIKQQKLQTDVCRFLHSRVLVLLSSSTFVLCPDTNETLFSTEDSPGWSTSELLCGAVPRIIIHRWQKVSFPVLSLESFMLVQWSCLRGVTERRRPFGLSVCVSTSLEFPWVTCSENMVLSEKHDNCSRGYLTVVARLWKPKIYSLWWTPRTCGQEFYRHWANGKNKCSLQHFWE